MILNPILPGCNPDPSICRKGGDFYLAVSSFEWFPGVPVYHSRDLKHWELYPNALSDPEALDLRGLPSAKGVWAPCLTYCEEDDLFYLVYGVMHSMNARYFDISNYLITAKDLAGPWSRPVYLHSMGFDASMFHDTDGRKYVVALEWETRAEHEKPGPISVMEYDPVQKRVTGRLKRIWRGGTDRGCLEAPHLTRRGNYYYLMCAEGGTGYYHSVTMARSESVFGPYEPDPLGPVLTSNTERHNERKDTDHLKARYYNPACSLQKAGHGSYSSIWKRPSARSMAVRCCSSCSWKTAGGRNIPGISFRSAAEEACGSGPGSAAGRHSSSGPGTGNSIRPSGRPWTPAFCPTSIRNTANSPAHLSALPARTGCSTKKQRILISLRCRIQIKEQSLQAADSPGVRLRAEGAALRAAAVQIGK